MAILISSFADDAHAIAMKWALENFYGADVDFKNNSDFPQKMRGTFSSDSGAFKLFGPDIARRDYTVIWDRRSPDIRLDEALHPADVEIATHIGRRFLRGYMDCSNDVRCVNRPDVAERIERKVFQLKLAKEVGLSLPETIVSNEIDDIRHFLASGFSCIVKPLKPMVWDTENGIINGNTNRIELADVWDEVAVSSCPMIYQREIEKKVEYRITVFGSEVHCIEIDSQSTPGAELDWRDLRHAKLPMREISCPDEVKFKILQFMKASELLHGSFDFILGTDGNYYFLEVNQQGQFLWLEQDATEGVALLDRGAQFLAEGGQADFVYAPSKTVASFREYLDNGYYQNDLAELGKRHIPSGPVGNIKEREFVEKEVPERL